MGSDLLKFTGIGLLGSFLKKDKKPASTEPSEAEKLETETKKKRQQRLAATESLNPTGTLGAGKASTTRSKVLGV